MRAAAIGLLALLLASAAPAQPEAPDVPHASAPDVPPGPARIEGVVRRAETGVPVAGAEVALYALTAEGVPGLRRTASDGAGHFVFENVANDPAIGWLVGARFEGVAFPGGRVQFPPGENVATLEVRVDQPTRDPRAIRVGEHSVRLLRQPGGLRAIETLGLTNEGANTYFVPADARAQARAALETVLPARASGFEMPLGVVPEGLVRSGNQLRWYGPVLPGAQELSWSFVLAPEAKAGAEAPERYAFSLRVPEHTERLAILLADPDATLEAPGLAGPEAAEVDGRQVRRWTLAAPPPGALALRVSLPPAREAPGAVSVSEVRAVVRLDDAVLDVTETHVLRIEGDTHVLGDADSPLLRITLPEGATKLRFGSDAPGLELASHAEGGLAVQGTVAPGEAQIELGYQLAVGEPPARLVRTLATRAPVYSVFVADTGRLAASSERLHRRRPLRTNDLTYLHFEAFEVGAGEEVALELGLLPPSARGSAALALGFVLAAAAGAAWLLISPLREQRAADSAAPAAELSSARREREALYEAIRDLDHDFETDKVAAEDHTRLRDELRGRAAALLAEERAASARLSEPHSTPGAAARTPTAASRGSSEPHSKPGASVRTPTAATGGPSEPHSKPGSAGRAASGASGGRSCPACGAPGDPSHRFCAQCGAALATPRGAA